MVRLHCGRGSEEGEGFTLIELLVVVGIIGVLSAILFPAAMRSIHAARSAQCMGNLRQIGSIIQLYMGDNNYAFPPANAVSGRPGLNWSGLWYAPNGGTGGLLSYVGNSQQAMNKLVVCPENRAVSTGNQWAYSVNYNVMASSTTNQVPVRAMSIPDLPQIILMTDSGTAVGSWNLGFNNTNSGWFAVTNRHDNLLNVLWADGHISANLKTNLQNTNCIP